MGAGGAFVGMSAACATTATPIAASAALVRRRFFMAPPNALPSRFRLTIQGQSVGIGCHLKSTVDRKRRSVALKAGKIPAYHWLAPSGYGAVRNAGQCEIRLAWL